VKSSLLALNFNTKKDHRDLRDYQDSLANQASLEIPASQDHLDLPDQSDPWDHTVLVVILAAGARTGRWANQERTVNPAHKENPV